MDLKDTLAVNESHIREDDACFWCDEIRTVGQLHHERCVIPQETALVRLTIDFVTNVPKNFTKEEVKAVDIDSRESGPCMVTWFDRILAAIGEHPMQELVDFCSLVNLKGLDPEGNTVYRSKGGCKFDENGHVEFVRYATEADHGRYAVVISDGSVGSTDCELNLPEPEDT